MIRIVTVILIAGSLIGAAVASDNTTGEQAQERVEKLHDALVQAMHQTDRVQREALLKPVIGEVFDVRNIARISVGRAWRKITPEEQQQLITDLDTLIVATYADRFDSYNDQRFVTDTTDQVKTGFVVKTRLLRVDDEPVMLDYYLRDAGVFNVVADGVSDLSLRRADYNSIIKQQGFAALMQHITQKIVEARNGNSESDE